MLSPNGRALALPLLLALLSAQLAGEYIELISNGSFTNGLTGWEVRGDVYFEYGDVVLYGRARLPASIAQTIDRPDLSLDLVFSYQFSTVFHLHFGSPYVEARIVAYTFNQTIMQEDAITLYSKKYYSAVPSPRNSYDISVNLKETYGGDLPKPFGRIRVILEAGFDDRSSMGGIQSIAYGYIHRVSLLMKPSPPPTVTATLTLTITQTEATTVTQTIQQRTPVMLAEPTFSLLFVTIAGVGAVICVAVHIYSKQKLIRR